MSVNQEIKEQRSKLKGAPLKEKLAYFWDYYKWHTIGAIVLIIIVISMVKDIRQSSRPIYIEGLYINASSLDSESVQDAYAEYFGVNQEETPVSITSMFITTDYSGQASDMTYSYYDKQRLMAMMSAAEIDFMVSDEAVALPYAAEGIFLDLTECFTKDELEQWKDSLLEVKYEDGTTHIVGIDVTSLPYIAKELQAYTYLEQFDEGNDQVFFAIVSNSKNVEKAKAYFDYIVSIQ